MAVGVLLGCAAFIVGYETKSLLIGESATEECRRRIVAAPRAAPSRSASSTCGPRTSARIPARRRQDRRAVRDDRRRAGGGHRRRGAAGPRGGADRGESTWSRTSTTRVRRTRRTRRWRSSSGPSAAPASGASAAPDGAQRAQGHAPLEVKRTARAGARGDMAGAAAQVGDGRPGSRSDSTRSPNASAAGVMSKRRSMASAAVMRRGPPR